MRQRIYLIASTLCCCVLAQINAAHAQSAASAAPTFRITSKNSQLALDIVGQSTAAGAAAQQAAISSSASQRWQLQPCGGGGYQVMNVGSGQCLDVEAASTEAGAHIQQWPCTSQANQEWFIETVGDGSYQLVSVNSGLSLDVIGVSQDAGAPLQQWTYWKGFNQQWFLQPLDANGSLTAGTVPGYRFAPHGNFTTALHPEKVGFYMTPDLDPNMETPTAVAPCPWPKLQTTLQKIHTLLPFTVVRWDNETGHQTDDPNSVDNFVSCANQAGVSMIVTASATDGYNNAFARNNTTPNASLLDFAQSPYLALPQTLMQKYAVVRLAETANEPDGPWFNTDIDSTADFDTYLQRLDGLMGNANGRILGPAVASTTSNIWNDFNSRVDRRYISYHTYAGANSLMDVPGKQVYVSEYGGYNLDPANVLADLRQAERTGKLSDSIQSLGYVNLLSSGRSGINVGASEGDAFALRDWLRALAMYQALTNVGGNQAYMNDSQPDFIATDNGTGGFGALLWNDSSDEETSGARSITGTSLYPATQLYVARVTPHDSGAVECLPYRAQTWVTVSSVSVPNATGEVTVRVADLPPHSAVLVSTMDCSALAR